MTLGSTALCTLANLKARLGITDSSSDTLLETLINVASSSIVGYVGRSLHYEEDIAEYVRSYGTARLQVARAPIWAIASIAYEGSTVDAASYEVRGRDRYTGAIYATGGWGWTAMRRGGTIAQDAMPGTERASFLVTYDAGYNTPSQTPTAGVDALPVDISEACILAATALYAKIGQDPTVQSESLLSYSVTYGNAKDVFGEYGLPALAQMILAQYRWTPMA
jgi:hypothetical protein